MKQISRLHAEHRCTPLAQLRRLSNACIPHSRKCFPQVPLAARRGSAECELLSVNGLYASWVYDIIVPLRAAHTRVAVRRDGKNRTREERRVSFASSCKRGGGGSTSASAAVGLFGPKRPTEITHGPDCRVTGSDASHVTFLKLLAANPVMISSAGPLICQSSL